MRLTFRLVPYSRTRLRFLESATRAILVLNLYFKWIPCVLASDGIDPGISQGMITCYLTSDSNKILVDPLTWIVSIQASTLQCFLNCCFIVELPTSLTCLSANEQLFSRHSAIIRLCLRRGAEYHRTVVYGDVPGSKGTAPIGRVAPIRPGGPHQAGWPP